MSETATATKPEATEHTSIDVINASNQGIKEGKTKADVATSLGMTADELTAFLQKMRKRGANRLVKEKNMDPAAAASKMRELIKTYPKGSKSADADAAINSLFEAHFVSSDESETDTKTGE